MTPDDAFFRDIIENPDDDTPRLIYADWLDDHGQPDRAAFVRVQIDLSRLPENARQRAELEAKERVLLAKHGDEWAGPLQGLLGRALTGFEFRRGFIEGVSLDARGFFGHVKQLFQLTPLRHLTVSLDRSQGQSPSIFTFVERLMSRLARLSPQFVRLKTLDLHGNSLRDAGVFALASSPHLSGLTGLNLSDNRIGDAGAEALAASVNLPRLAVLVLSGNYIENPGALALARSDSLAGLTLLELDANPIWMEGRWALKARFGDRVHF